MINFSTIKGITIPNGEVSKISIGSLNIWQKEETPKYKNLAEPNETNTSDWSIWCNNSRMGSDGTKRTLNGYSTTNYIPAVVGDVIRVRDLNFESLSGYPFLGLFDSNKALLVLGMNNLQVMMNNGYISDVVTSANEIQFKLAYGAMKFIRLSGKPTKTPMDVIITVNEEIV